jgi:hypothetical protein
VGARLMGTMASPRQFERIIDLARGDLTSPEFQKWHAEVARQLLAETLAGMAAKPAVQTVVDGRVDAVEDSVKLYGTIRYNFITLGNAVQEVLDWLVAEGSRVGPEYGNGFFVAVLKAGKAGKGGRPFTAFAPAGRMIPARQFAASSRGLPTDAEFIIGNGVPYNRKVDVQMVGGQRMSFGIGAMIFDRAAAFVRARHPDLVAQRVHNLFFDADPATGEPRWIIRRGRNAGKPVQSPGLVIRRGD